MLLIGSFNSTLSTSENIYSCGCSNTYCPVPVRILTNSLLYSLHLWHYVFFRCSLWLCWDNDILESMTERHTCSSYTLNARSDLLNGLYICENQFCFDSIFFPVWEGFTKPSLLIPCPMVVGEPSMPGVIYSMDYTFVKTSDIFFE